MPATLLTSHIEVSEHLQFRKTDEQEFFEKKEGVGVIRENFEKYHGTFLLFHSWRRWVGGYFQKFRKVSICSIKKVPAPPPPPPPGLSKISFFIVLKATGSVKNSNLNNFKLKTHLKCRNIHCTTIENVTLIFHVHYTIYTNI